MAKREIRKGNEALAPERRLTMDDLAALAGVSSITISRALKGSPLVRPHVRDKIQELAREQGYRLNTAARNLRLRRNHRITAVIEMTPNSDRTMSDPIILGALGGLLQVTTAAGYQLILTTLAQLLEASHDDTDGFILLGQGKDPSAVTKLAAQRLPLVVWGTPCADDGGWLTVGSDNRRGGKLIGEHLARLGRRRILFLGDPAHPEIADRLHAIREASDVEVEVQPSEFGIVAGSQAMIAAMARGWQGDAVAAASDTIALGALAVLQQAGIAIPDDMVLTGFDGIPAAAAAAVPLTTVRQDWGAAGELLATTLLEWLDGRRPDPRFLPVELIIRASTGGA